MNVQKKAFRPIYRAIADKQLTEREAYDILCGIFRIEYIPIDMTPPFTDDSSLIEEQQTNEITVKGFQNGRY